MTKKKVKVKKTRLTKKKLENRWQKKEDAIELQRQLSAQIKRAEYGLFQRLSYEDRVEVVSQRWLRSSLLGEEQDD